MSERNKYSSEFKAEAVRRFREAKAKGESVRAVSKELNITESLLYLWARQQPAGARSATGIVARPAAAKGSTPTTVAMPSKGGRHGNRYPPEFKQKCLDLMASGMKPKDVAAQMGVETSSLYQWRNKEPGENASPPAAATVTPAGQLVPVATGASLNGLLRDVLIYLRHAEEDLMDRIRAGKLARPDSAHLLTLLALEELKKAINS